MYLRLSGVDRYLYFTMPVQRENDIPARSGIFYI